MNIKSWKVIVFGNQILDKHTPAQVSQTHNSRGETGKILLLYVCTIDALMSNLSPRMFILALTYDMQHRADI